MKRNWDLIREILIKTESLDLNKQLTLNDFKDSVHREILHQVQILNEADFIKAIIPSSAAGLTGFYIESLTWKGHELLDLMRQNSLWNKIKSFVKEKGIELTFDSILAAGKHLITNQN